MFDSISVLGRPRRGFGRPAAVSLGLHSLVIAVVALVTRAAIVERSPEPPVVRVVKPSMGFGGPTTPPRGPAQSDTSVRQTTEVPRKVRTTPTRVATAELPPKETVPEPALADAALSAATADDGGGGAGNPAGNGTRGGGWAGQDGPAQFDESLMTPPRRLSGPDPEYTEQAREKEIEGAMVVKCVVTAQGIVRDCRVIQGLPHMNEAVVRALLRRRYEPARLANGAAVDVDYTFHLRFQIDR